MKNRLRKLNCQALRVDGSGGGSGIDGSTEFIGGSTVDGKKVYSNFPIVAATVGLGSAGGLFGRTFARFYPPAEPHRLLRQPKIDGNARHRKELKQRHLQNAA
ncbi:MAG: hypothetical protein GXP26_14855 [Planctomycetes bacterium]|nr:hypothetical protein [Planctomycetota bacterium]